MNVGLLALGKVWGGAEIHTAHLAHALCERGDHAEVVGLTGITCALFHNRSPVPVSIDRLLAPKAWREMGCRDWVRLFQPRQWDVCVLVKGTFETGTWALDLAARSRCEHYLTIEHLPGDAVPRKASRRHFGFVPGLGLWWYRERLRQFLRSVAPRRVICVSEAVRERLTRDYRFAPRKVVTVHNGIDVGRFRFDPLQGDRWRRRWGIPDDALVFGALGRLAPIKGYDVALAGFQEVLKHHPGKNPWLVLVGEGEAERELRDLASQICPPGRIVFSPFSDRPWEPLSALDVFLMPSLNEGLPLTLLEAMACGVCPVATAVGGIPEVVTDSGLGWVVPAGDGTAFAAAMLAAAATPLPTRVALSRRVTERVREKFNASVQFARTAELIESVAQGVGFRPSGQAPCSLPAPARGRFPRPARALPL